MKKTPSVYLICPIHNGIKNTIECISNIKQLSYRPIETIVVDDGSTDGSDAYIKSHHPGIILLKGTGNLWWSGSVNLGVRYALDKNADYVCLINNDNTFQNDFLSILVETAREKGAMAVCSKVFYKDSRVVFFAGGIRNKWGELVMLDGKDREKYNIERIVEWTTGMGVLINSRVFKNIGFFDEKNFPHYYGDSDFGLRMTAQGYKIHYQPHSVIYNDYHSTGFSFYSGKPSDLFRGFFSVKSVSNIKICHRFYQKHASKYAFFLTLKGTLRALYNFFRVIITRKSKFEIKKDR
jgi:GT2 family glycosyltransferase